ncbi:LPD7 domain-containing protein [Asticcacaulis sp. EMRT-3]|uniref:LPD7 domain-containing protein n=1 Tax=Asticcacaulis sp. EMRT-3 TaxID=3040349 RepID=UPI0024AF2DC7|nr:LPD7 domain-containing protein [Asticcacaulis sp. EMRT-3]MDI7776566.1 hypothetical protein [Asticcacaulis sp. EMRT-3]
MNEIEDGRDRQHGEESDGTRRQDLDKLVSELDAQMKASQLAEKGWRDRGDLDAMMASLEKLSHIAPSAAIELWDKYRPGDQDKPIFIDNDDKDPGAKSKAHLGDKADDPAIKPRPIAEALDFEVPAALKKRYMIAGDTYHLRDHDNTLAFHDQGRRLTTSLDDPEVARSMVELADAKGWKTLNLKGSEAFKREVWLHARLKGLETEGFRPKAVDLAKLEERRAARPKKPDAQLNSIAPTERARSAPGQDRGIEDVVPPLTDKQVVVIDALKAIMRQRGDSEKAVALAEEMARERLQSNRVYVGKIVERGTSPFENDPKNPPHPYVKLETSKGMHTVWGADLPRALDEGGAKIGDDIALVSRGKQPVTVTIKDKEAASGEKSITANRNIWEVRRLETLREEVKARLRSHEATALQPGVQIFAPDAPRSEQRGEAAPTLKVTKERSRA